MKELRTTRMTLRPFTRGDEDALHALHSDPAVMRHLEPPSTRPEVQVWLDRHLGLHERYTGLGYAAAIETTTGAFLGWFQFDPPDPLASPAEVELGYRLHTAAWGRGFATEGSVALIERGFSELGVRRVAASTTVVNLGSRRVLERVGLRHVRTVHLHWPEPLPGAEHGDAEYALTRTEWVTARRMPPAAPPGPCGARPPSPARPGATGRPGRGRRGQRRSRRSAGWC